MLVGCIYIHNTDLQTKKWYYAFYCDLLRHQTHNYMYLLLSWYPLPLCIISKSNNVLFSIDLIIVTKIKIVHSFVDLSDLSTGV